MADVAVDWFEIPASDVNRAVAFYENVLQTKLGEMPGPDGPMKVFMNGEMPAGALDGSEHASSSTSGPLVYFNTDDVAAALSRATAAGGSVALDTMSIGDYGTIGHFVDSEGNRVALHANS